MRLCQRLLCDETATVWFRGPWCSLHANILGDEPYRAFESRVPPVDPGRAVGRVSSGMVTTLSSPEAPARIRTEDEFLDLLDERGWGLLDLEYILLDALGEMS
jgi:hypothetical protein